MKLWRVSPVIVEIWVFGNSRIWEHGLKSAGHIEWGQHRGGVVCNKGAGISKHFCPENITSPEAWIPYIELQGLMSSVLHFYVWLFQIHWFFYFSIKNSLFILHTNPSCLFFPPPSISLHPTPMYSSEMPRAPMGIQKSQSCHFEVGPRPSSSQDLGWERQNIQKSQETRLQKTK